MQMTGRPGWQTAVILWAACVALVLGGVLVTNVVIDPYNLTLLVTRAGLNAELRDLALQSRWSKAAGLIRERPRTLLLGSSVVDHGFALPGSTDFDSHRLQHHADLVAAVVPIYNAGIRGGGTDDSVKYLRHALVNSADLKQVIAGFEWTLFSDLKRNGPAVPDSSLLYHRHLTPQALTKYLTWTALYESALTLTVNLGLHQQNLRDFWQTIRGRLAKDFGVPYQTRRLRFYTGVPFHARSVEETRVLFFSRFFSAAMLAARNRNGPRALYREDALQDVRDLVALAQEKHVPLTLYISPMHPVFWAYIRTIGLWKDHLAWLRELAKITPFYDFSASADFSPEADAYFATDPLHFSPMLGQRLQQYFETGSSPSGLSARYVTAETVEDDIARRDQDLSDWLAKNQDVAEIVAGSALSAADGTLAGSTATARGDEHHGFRFVQFADRFYGLPGNEWPYDFLKVLRGDYQPMVVAASLSQAIAEIDRRGLESQNFAAVGLVNGTPMASGDNAGVPGRAFDGDPETAWVSVEHGAAIDGNAWLGYAFSEPQVVRRMVVAQPINPVYRQDRIRVQSSRDGGLNWVDVLPNPAHLFDDEETSVIKLPESDPASCWRIVAADPTIDTPIGPKLAWKVEEFVFFASRGGGKP